VLHRGHGRVARRLVTLTLDGALADSRVEPRAKVLTGDREVGVVTSVATSPASGAIALAYIHRDLAVADARVAVETPVGRVSATVSVQPLR